MKVSLHRRRHESLPPRPRRSPLVLVMAAIATTAGVAWGASRFEREAPPPVSPAVASAEQATRDLVDLRVRAHLRALPRG